MQLLLGPVELGGDLGQPRLHRRHRTTEREVLVSGRQGHVPDTLAAEEGLHSLGGAVRGDDHAADRVGIDPGRHEDEAIAELRPQSLAQRLDDRLVARC